MASKQCCTYADESGPQICGGSGAVTARSCVRIELLYFTLLVGVVDNNWQFFKLPLDLHVPFLVKLSQCFTTCFSVAAGKVILTFWNES